MKSVEPENNFDFYFIENDMANNENIFVLAKENEIKKIKKK